MTQAETKKRLNTLQEIDYGGEEILGKNFDHFYNLINFFYELHSDFGSIEAFLEAMPSQGAGKRDQKFQDNLALLGFTSEKFSDFKSLHSKINDTGNTLNKQIERVLREGCVQIEEQNREEPFR